jgi:hypothetical protein
VNLEFATNTEPAVTKLHDPDASSEPAMKQASAKKWIYLGLLGTVGLVVVSQIHWPTPQEAARERCMGTYDPRDWDVVESLSNPRSAVIEALPCNDQHAALNHLAHLATDRRDRWLDDQAHARHYSPLPSDTPEK